jgi:hypothetical protein
MRFKHYLGRVLYKIDGTDHVVACQEKHCIIRRISFYAERYVLNIIRERQGSGFPNVGANR